VHRRRVISDPTLDPKSHKLNLTECLSVEQGMNTCTLNCSAGIKELKSVQKSARASVLSLALLFLYCLQYLHNPLKTEAGLKNISDYCSCLTENIFCHHYKGHAEKFCVRGKSLFRESYETQTQCGNTEAFLLLDRWYVCIPQCFKRLIPLLLSTISLIIIYLFFPLFFFINFSHS
jgi:hypothetical protein